MSYDLVNLSVSWSFHMSYRYACFVSILSVGLFLSEASYGQEPSKPYVMSQAETPTTEEDVSNAMSLIGLEIERFQFELPRSRQFRFSSYRYRNGEEHLKVNTTKRFSVPSGKNELMLVKFKTSKDTFRFGIQLGDGQHLTTGISGSEDDTRFTASHSFAHAKLATRRKTPFYVLAADPDRVTDFGTNESEERIKEYIKENKWVWIAYVEMR